MDIVFFCWKKAIFKFAYLDKDNNNKIKTFKKKMSHKWFTWPLHHLYYFLPWKERNSSISHRCFVCLFTIQWCAKKMMISFFREYHKVKAIKLDSWWQNEFIAYLFSPTIFTHLCHFYSKFNWLLPPPHHLHHTIKKNLF